jgi:hypothetical protein
MTQRKRPQIFIDRENERIERMRVFKMDKGKGDVERVEESV